MQLRSEACRNGELENAIASIVVRPLRGHAELTMVAARTGIATEDSDESCGDSGSIPLRFS